MYCSASCLLGTQRTPQLEATIYLHHLTETYYCLKAMHCSETWCMYAIQSIKYLFSTVSFCSYTVLKVLSDKSLLCYGTSLYSSFDVLHFTKECTSS